MMPNLSIRSDLPEKMDDLAAPQDELRQNLRELEVINKYLGGYSVVLDALKKLHWPAKKMTIMDLGCGGGDMLRAIAEWGDRRQIRSRLVGVDLNPVMIAYAKEASTKFPAIEYMLANVFDESLLMERADIVICSLFCHHFKDDELVTLLQRMAAIAGTAIIVNDLHRHWYAYYSISILTALFSKTYMVKHDARLSVARAFTRSDWVRILKAAGVKNYTLKWRWAFRWELIIHTSQQ